MKLRWTIAHDKKLVVVHIRSQLDPEEVRRLYAVDFANALDQLLVRGSSGWRNSRASAFHAPR